MATNYDVALRFLVCGSDKEVKLSEDYLTGAGRKFIRSEKTDLTELTDGLMSMKVTVIWYVGSGLDQDKLVELLGGVTLF